MFSSHGRAPMPMFNVPQALLWIANYQARKFSADDLKARLTYLADSPSLFAVHQMFSKKGKLPEDNTRSDIQESLSAEIEDPAEVIFKNSHDDLVQNLFAGKIAMRGRPVQTQACAIPFSVSFGYLLGCAPISHLEVIPAAAFGDLQFKDREGVEAVPLDFPSREFPRWRDLSLSGDDVRRLWPERKRAPASRLGRAPAADWDALQCGIGVECRKHGYIPPDSDGPLGWKTQADVEKWAAKFLTSRMENASESTLREHVKEALLSLKA